MYGLCCSFVVASLSVLLATALIVTCSFICDVFIIYLFGFVIKSKINDQIHMTAVEFQRTKSRVCIYLKLERLFKVKVIWATNWSRFGVEDIHRFLTCVCLGVV